MYIIYIIIILYYIYNIYIYIYIIYIYINIYYIKSLSLTVRLGGATSKWGITPIPDASHGEDFPWDLMGFADRQTNSSWLVVEPPL